MAGLAGTLANTLAIRLVQRTGVPPGSGGLSKMALALANSLLGTAGLDFRLPVNLGPVGQELFHTALGLGMALIYACFAYRLLPGPGWLRGLLFCQAAWLMQAFVVLPWTGAGVIGLRLSPLTPWASFALNSLYGLILGSCYRPSHSGTLTSAGDGNLSPGTR